MNLLGRICKAKTILQAASSGGFDFVRLNDDQPGARAENKQLLEKDGNECEVFQEVAQIQQEQEKTVHGTVQAISSDSESVGSCYVEPYELSEHVADSGEADRESDDDVLFSPRPRVTAPLRNVQARVTLRLRMGSIILIR